MPCTAGSSINYYKSQKRKHVGQFLHSDHRITLEDTLENVFELWLLIRTVDDNIDGDSCQVHNARNIRKS